MVFNNKLDGKWKEVHFKIQAAVGLTGFPQNDGSRIQHDISVRGLVTPYLKIGFQRHLAWIEAGLPNTITTPLLLSSKQPIRTDSFLRQKSKSNRQCASS